MYYGNSENIILTDVDGVLLNWSQAFDVWMSKRVYEMNEEFKDEYDMTIRYSLSKTEAYDMVKTFNESASIRKLAPFRDAIKYVKKLHEEHGYVFHVITSMTLDEDAWELRIENLERLFGKNVFQKYMFCNVAAHKRDKLKQYQDSGLFWIEDNYDNCVDGEELGLEPILMNHPFNSQIETSIPRVNNWKEIYNIITGE